MFKVFQDQIDQAISNLGFSTQVRLLKPPSPDLGDFCIVVNQISKDIEPLNLAKKITPTLSEIENIAEINIFEAGKKKKKIIYLNFKVNELAKKQILAAYIEKILNNCLDINLGLTEKNGLKALVEHTSANPISPIHVGNLRNSIHGDTIARILERLGYEVFRHFYVNDVGLQVSYVVIGYEILIKQNIRPSIKVDLWFGQIYAIMYNFYSIQNIKITNKELFSSEHYILTQEEIKKYSNSFTSILEQISTNIENLEKVENTKDEKKKISELKRQRKKITNRIKNVNKLYDNQISLTRRFKQLYTNLKQQVNTIDLVQTTAKYLQLYEDGKDKRIVELFRSAVDWILQAFQWTLARYNIKFDKFDYESDVTWSGLHKRVIGTLSKSNNISQVEGSAIRYSFPKSALKKMIKASDNQIKIPIKGEIPELQLTRSDGTALYPAKDIAYSIQKYHEYKPAIILNVISSEQILPQFQLLLPLFELGEKEIVKSMRHYSYEIVELRGRPMSGRQAIYVTADEFFDETILRARMAKRQSDTQRGHDIPKTMEEWEIENSILHNVALASTRFPLIETSPNRKIIIDVDRELDFKRNSGPFVQYAHARTCSILRKAETEQQLTPSHHIEYTLLVDNLIIEILEHISSINKVLKQSIDKLDPSIVANWVFNLAQLFMKFYERYPILKIKDIELKKARLSLVLAIKNGIAFGLETLGITPAQVL